MKKYIISKYLLLYIVLVAANVALAQVPAGLKTETTKNRTIKLLWSIPKMPQQNIQHYKIYWGEVSNPTDFRLTQWYNAKDTTTEFQNLNYAKTYYFRVSTIDNNNVESAKSTETATKPKDFMPCEVPQNLKAYTGDTQLILNWDAIANAESDFKNYKIYRGETPSNQTLIGTSTTTEYTDLNVTNDLEYYYRISSVDIAGNESTKSMFAKGIPILHESGANDITPDVLNGSMTGYLNGTASKYFYIYITKGVPFKIFTSAPKFKESAVQGTEIELIMTDPSYLVVGSDVNSGANGYSEIQVTSNYSGIYMIKVSPATQSTTGYFQISFLNLYPDAYEPNNDFTTATFQPDWINIYPANDVDYVYTNGTVNQTLNCVTYAENFAGKLSLFNESKQLLKSANTASVLDTLKYFLNESGKYYVKYEAQNAGNTALDHIFELKLSTPNDIPSQTIHHQVGWLETFDNNILSSQWTVLNYNFDNQHWKTLSGSGINFTGALNLSGSGAANNDWIVTPIFDVPNTADNCQLSFYTKTNSSDYEKFEIWIGDASMLSSSLFTKIKTDSINTTVFKKYSVDLTAYKNKTVRLIIRNITVNANQQLIDNVSFEKIPYNNIVEGYVTDFTSSAKLSGVFVTLNKQTVSTNSIGFYQFTHQTEGTRQLIFEKAGYQTAYVNINVKEPIITQHNVKLLQLQENNIYSSGFEFGEDEGIAGFTANRWHVEGSFAMNASSISPKSGSKMLVYGGNAGYQASDVAYWGNLKIGDLDLSKAVSAELTFSANFNLETKADIVKLMGKNSKHNPIAIAIQNDADAMYNGGFTGNSNGWKTYTVDLKDYCGAVNGNNVEIGFLAQTNANNNATNWGIAIDDIKIRLYERNLITAPTGVMATWFVDNKINLDWTLPAGNPKFNIYRADSSGVYTMIGTASTNTFSDVNVVNKRKYWYKITTVFEYGESELIKSEFAEGIAGTPQQIYIAKNRGLGDEKYIQNFEADKDKIPYNWHFDTKNTRYTWNFGDSILSETNFFRYPSAANCLYVSDYNPQPDNNKGEAVTATPWLNTGYQGSKAALRFKSYSRNSQSEKHYVVMRGIDALNHLTEWKIIDSIKTNDKFEWKSYFLKTSGTYSQIGFIMQNSGIGLNTATNGWAIDSLTIADIAPGDIDGYVLSNANLPIFNAKVEMPELKYVTYTDKNGFFAFKSDFTKPELTLPIFAGRNYNLVVSADYYITRNTQSLTIKDNATVHESIKLEYIAEPVKNLKVQYTPEGYSVLSWDKYLPNYQTKDDDGISDNATLVSKCRYLFKSDKNVPLMLKQLLCKVNYQKDNSTLEYIRIYSEDAKDTVYNATNVKMDSLYADGSFAWAGIPLNCISKYNTFWIEISSNKPISFAADFVSSLLQQEQVENEWKMSPLSAIVRLEFETGSSFTNKYNVYKATANQVFSLIAENVAINQFTDKLNPELKYVAYQVKAVLNSGLSPASNTVLTKKDILAYLEKNSGMDTAVINNFVAIKKTLKLKNIGRDNLKYSVSYFSGYMPEVFDQEKNTNSGLAHWSHMRCYMNTPKAGDTLDLKIFIENEYKYSLWITQATLSFPNGITVISSSHFTEVGRPHALHTNENKGNNATIEWHTPTGFGALISGQIAVATVRIAIANNYAGDFSFDYTITGDKPELPVNVLKNKLTFDNTPFTVNLATTQGSIAQGSVFALNTTVQINSAKTGYYPGYILFKSNDINDTIKYIPYNILLKPKVASVSGTVTNMQNKSLRAESS